MWTYEQFDGKVVNWYSEEDYNKLVDEIKELKDKIRELIGDK